MVWKILSLVSAGCLAAACFFAWSNQKAFKQETRRLDAAQANLESVQSRKAEGDEQLSAKQAQLATLEKDRDATKEEVVKLAAEAQEKEAALAILKTNLDQVVQQVTSLEKQIEEAGDIRSLVAQIEALEKELQNAEGALAKQKEREAGVRGQIEALSAQITNMREAAGRASKGIVDADFTARVAQFFPEWDFAILNKGNAGGVFANADLEVKRGRNVIAKLKVRNVEQGSSVADLVPGSLAEGESIRSGDVVVAASTQTARTETRSSSGGTTPAPDQDAPETAEMTDTPAPPMGTDPFGAPAMPDTPAPPMGTDPFGAPAPAMPETPAPAMGADPFGAPTAPAPGTPASPSTADPFGAAPNP